MSAEENAVVPSSPVNSPPVNTSACIVCLNPKVMDENFYDEKCCKACFRFFSQFLESPIQYFCCSDGYCTIDGSKDYASGKITKHRCKSCWLKICLKIFVISDDLTRTIKDFLPCLETPPQRPPSPTESTNMRAADDTQIDEVRKRSIQFRNSGIPSGTIEEWIKDHFNREANMNAVPQDIMIKELESPASSRAAPTETTCHICGKRADTSEYRFGGICCKSCVSLFDEESEYTYSDQESPASPPSAPTETTCHICGKQADTSEYRFGGICCKSCISLFDEESEFKNSDQVSVENAGNSLETPFLNLGDKTVDEEKITISLKIPRALTFEEPDPQKSVLTKRMVKRAVSSAMNDPVLQQKLEDPRIKLRRIARERLTKSEFPLPSFSKHFARLSSEYLFSSTLTTPAVVSQVPHTQAGTAKTIPIGTINPQQAFLQLQQSQLDLKENEIECQFKSWEMQFKFWKKQNICHPDKKNYVKYIKLAQKWKREIQKMRVKRLKDKSERKVASNQNFPSTNSASVVNPDAAVIPATSSDTPDEPLDDEAISVTATSAAMDQPSNIDAFSFAATPLAMDQTSDTDASSATPLAIDQSSDIGAPSAPLAMDLSFDIDASPATATPLTVDQPSDSNVPSVVNPDAAECYQLSQYFFPRGMSAAPSITVTPAVPDEPSDDEIFITASDIYAAAAALMAIDKPLTTDTEEFSVENSNRSQGS